MNQIPWANALPIFVATLPLLGAVLWNLMDTKAQFTALRAEIAQIRSEMAAIRVEISAIKADIASIRERVAILEERDRLSHPVLAK